MMRGFLTAVSTDVSVLSAAAASGVASGSPASVVAGVGFCSGASATGFCVTGVPVLCLRNLVLGDLFLSSAYDVTVLNLTTFASLQQSAPIVVIVFLNNSNYK